MTTFPSAIIIINDDISASVKTNIIRQLHIDLIQDGYTFDSNVLANADYTTDTKNQGHRLMIMRTFSDREDVDTWDLADIVLFVKNGMAAVEKNKLGPHDLTLPVLKLYWGALGIY